MRETVCLLTETGLDPRWLLVSRRVDPRPRDNCQRLQVSPLGKAWLCPHRFASCCVRSARL
jgi:hypothetical protein